MSIASELQDLNDNLVAAKDAVVAKGGTVGDTGLAGLSSEIASVPQQTVGKPTTWANFAAMTVAEQQFLYNVRDAVGIACPWTSPSSSTAYSDLIWEIAGWGTTKKENDDTIYPCVVLISRLETDGTYQFDAAETPTQATEETAQAGVYYFGYNGGSNYTKLSLSVGGTIPYGDYTAVYKTGLDVSADDFRWVSTRGCNIYKDSAVRQWLNSDATGGNWWQSSHVGDVAPSYSNQAGFMHGLDSGFKAILQKTEVATWQAAGYGSSEYKTYDYLFLLSQRELSVTGSQTVVEGDALDYFKVNSTVIQGLRSRAKINGDPAAVYWLRTAMQGSVADGYGIYGAGNLDDYSMYPMSSYSIVPACKIILAG